MPQPPQLSAEKQAWLKKRLDDLNNSGEHADALTIGPRPANEPLPLSFAQQRLWFLQHLEPESAAYNEALAARLEGELDLEAFTRMIREVLSRHEVVRCRFPLREGQVEPVLDEQVSQTFEVPCEDLRGLAATERETALMERMQQELQRPFDLTTELPWRTVLLRLEEQEYVSLTILHHLITDGWSWGVMYREFRTLYAAFSQQQPSPLPALPIQYGDYASWQRRWIESEEAQRQAAYWQNRLAGPLPHLDLPTDRPRGEENSAHGGRVMLELGAVLGQQVQTFGRQEGITPFMLLEAALVILLYRLTQQEEVLVGVPVAGRTQPELETLCGCFVNTLVLRQRVEGTLTVRELLQRVREETLAASDHQEYPFEKLVELLQPERDLGRTPFFEVLFSLQNTPREPFALPGVRWTPLEVVNHAAKFALSVALQESEEGIEGYLEYQAALFDSGTVERIGRQYVQIVREMVRDPEQQVGEIALWAEQEQEEVLARWNATEVAYPAEGSYRAYVQAQVQAQPQAVAVRDGQDMLSYAQLWQRATRVSAHLQGKRRTGGTETREVLVGVYLERSVRWAVVVLAVLLAGDAYLPLEPGQPAGRVRYMVEHAGCRRIVTTRGQEQELRAALADMAEQIEILYVEELLEQEPEQAYQEGEIEQQQLAYVIYTSGSTGKPKGVMVEQRGLLNHLLAKVETLQLEAGDVVAQTASASFDISLWQLLAAWLVGATVRIYPTEIVMDQAALLRAVHEDGISVLVAVPSLLRALLDEIESTGRERYPLEHLRWLIATGEALPADLCRRWFACYPQVPLVNAYGPSECSDNVSHYMLTKPPRASETRVPIGRPLPNLRLYVLDERMRPQPVGVWGEIYVGGSGVGRGYLDDAARTAQAFIPDPWSREPGARLYRTGDRGRFRANGTLEFGGRRDQQIKLRGYRIELEEIEAVIGRCRQVRTCAVGVVGEHASSEQLVAYVVLEEGVEGSLEEALGEVRESLPAYMLPSAVVVLAELPLLASGKVDRKALHELAGQEQRAEYVEPRTEVEQQLAAIWREVLALERIGIHDNFFAIGGHSLLITRILTRVREVFDVWLSVRSMFKKPTIAGMAASIEDVRARSSALRQKRPAPVSREAYRQKRVVLLQDRQSLDE